MSPTVSTERKALKYFTFSDGTLVPAGTIIGVPLRAVQRDEVRTHIQSHSRALVFSHFYCFRSIQAYFPNGDKFEGFRFAEMREEDGESLKHQMVSLTAGFYLFGHGKHAW